MIRNIAFLALLGGACFPAAAVEVALGNLAPGTVERGPVAVFVDGDRVERNLVYRRFVRVDLPAGTHEVRFVGAADTPDGIPLASRNVVIAQRNGTTPTVVLAGNGAGQPYSVELHDGGTQPASTAQRPSISMHHLAPFPRAESTEVALDASAECRNNQRDGSAGSGRVVYRGEFVFDPGSAPRLNCSASFSLAGVGGFSLAGLSLPPNNVMRAYLIGDAVNAPFEIIAVVGAEVQSLSSAGAPEPSAILKSPTFWFDPERPTQGINLYEQAAGNDAYGTWYTFAADGHPVWYALTGGVGTSFGRREFTVYESRRGEVQALGVVGSAVLTYFDCNTAEFRAVLNGNDLRTLRLKRSRPVEVCTALDRND